MSMETGGFGVSDKASPSPSPSSSSSAARAASSIDDDRLEGGGLGLGLKLQRIESFPFRITAHQDRPFPSSATSGGDGPTPLIGDGDDHIYYVSAAAAAAAGAGAGTAGDAAVLKANLQQPFLVSTSTASSSSPSSFTPSTAFKSPGAAGGMAASVGFPFTVAQWRELERQAMIYKYMMASVPVPPDLLTLDPFLPSSATSHYHTLVGGSAASVLNLRFANGSADPEPGRCRRTDGKKWRCSRDVAPNQKYCERHLHRGRPRSRKPVELKAPENLNPCKVSESTLKNNGASASASSSPSSLFLKPTTQESHQRPAASHFQSCFSAANSYKEPRSLEWAMKQDETDQQYWQRLMQTKIGLTTETSFSSASTSVFHQHYEPEEPPKYLNAYRQFATCEDKQQSPRAFIDAWSNAVTDTPAAANNNDSSISSNAKLCLSNLNLSMAMAGGELIEEEMGLEADATDHSDRNNRNCHVSWAASAPGGPLAEVLRRSGVAASTSTSPHPGHGDSGSPPATGMSSPSGVLHKTLVSLSDSSGSSSPTIGTSTARSEIAFWLMNHNT
ncbi:growth-regulating factor 7 [Malania oleifera]|uniref:growth-regulating factor 7 n=1 Tax=Malania oleifera TaxID=397392 RepID=UPI0025ADE36C|nr:growth-regulating factor 7 [Malania oleifera]